MFLLWIIDFMLAGKTLIDCTSLFSPYDFQKIVNIILSHFKMNECNSIETLNKYLNLSDQTNCRMKSVMLKTLLILKFGKEK